jgi:hypothetical protein
MSVTIEPTVTPAPKPEWPEITTYICRDKYGDIFPCMCPEADMLESELVHLATVVIPSSAECERRAKVEAARERVIEIARQLDTLGSGMILLHKALTELRTIEQEAP